MTIADVPRFHALFGTFLRSAWRWECQPVYREPAEQEPLRRFQAGEPADDAWRADFLATVADIIAAGKTFARVRVLDDPPNDYRRFVMDLADRGNIPAGEDVRIRWMRELGGLDLPDHDFWIFDDVTVARMHFGDAGLAGVDILTGDAVEQYRRWKRIAWDHSLPFDAYRVAVRRPAEGA